jgi:hypothetical protein
MLRAIALALREIVALWPDFCAWIVAAQTEKRLGAEFDRRLVAIILPPQELNYV